VCVCVCVCVCIAGVCVCCGQQAPGPGQTGTAVSPVCAAPFVRVTAGQGRAAGGVAQRQRRGAGGRQEVCVRLAAEHWCAHTSPAGRGPQACLALHCARAPARRMLHTGVRLSSVRSMTGWQGSTPSCSSRWPRATPRTWRCSSTTARRWRRGARSGMQCSRRTSSSWTRCSRCGAWRTRQRHSCGVFGVTPGRARLRAHACRSSLRHPCPWLPWPSPTGV
jgi:hypothetical protein